MKKYIILLVLFPILLTAQRRGHSEKNDKIESIYIAHITNEMDLNVEESKTFWPIYNDYRKKRDQLVRPSFYDMESSEVTENNADKMMAEIFTYDEQKMAIKKELYKELSKEFSADRLLHLMRAEYRFKKKMFDSVKRQKS